MISLWRHKKQNTAKNNRETLVGFPDFIICGDELNKKVKQRAKKLIKGRKRSVVPAVFSLFFASAGVFFIRMFLTEGRTFFALLLSALLSVAYVLFRICVNYRLQVQMITALNGGETKIKAGEYLKSIFLSFRLFLRKSAELIAFEFLPLVMTVVLFFGISIKGISRKSCIIVLIGAAAVAVSGLVFYVFSVQKYAKAPFLLAAYPSLAVGECIELSRVQGEEKAAELLRFKIGFLKWIPLCVAIFPLLYLIPYYKQSLTCRFVTREF